MNDRETARYDMFGRVQTFGIDNADDFRAPASSSQRDLVTAAVGRLIRSGMKEVNYLNAIIHNKYSRNADKLRAWKSASHIDRAPKREKPPTTPPSP